MSAKANNAKVVAEAAPRQPRPLSALEHWKGAGMDVDPAALKPALTRLKRANGQLEAVIRMIEAGRPCEDVVMQIAAVSRAIDRAGFAVIAQSMRACLNEENPGEKLDVDKLEKLFLSLS